MSAFNNWDKAAVDAHNARVARGSLPAVIGGGSPVSEPIQPSFAMDANRPSYRLTLPWPPSSNHYNRQRVVVPKQPGKKPFVMYYPSEEAKQFTARAQAIAKASGIPLLHGRLLAVVNYYFPTAAGDLQNRSKVLLDTLEGILYPNDKQITRTEEERFEDPENPRVEITLQERL